MKQKNYSFGQNYFIVCGWHLMRTFQDDAASAYE